MNAKPKETQRARVLALVASGLESSAAIARALGLEQSAVAVELSRLHEAGRIERAPSRPAARGRPFARWRLVGAGKGGPSA